MHKHIAVYIHIFFNTHVLLMSVWKREDISDTREWNRPKDDMAHTWDGACFQILSYKFGIYNRLRVHKKY